MRPSLVLLALGIGMLQVGEAAANEADSVVRVFAKARDPDLLQPWRRLDPLEFTGSGVVIEGKQILTNAHLVLYATEVYVQGHRGGEKIEAKVKVIGPGIDLALLTLDNPDFFTKHPPLARSKDFLKERLPVEVYGYPIGGNNLSITKGIVSRVEYAVYNHQTMGLRGQIDAAVNNGNSGGPVLVGNRMVGLVFSRLTQGQNIGYIIPNEEIESFLEEVAPSGRYQGKPALDLRLQTLENPVLRRHLGLDSAVRGVLASRSSGLIHKYDILTKIGPYAIDNQGMIQARDNLTLSFHYVVPKLAKDGKVPVTVLRKAKEVSLDLPVSRSNDLLIPELRGEFPKYFLYGPLVFSPACFDAIGAYASRNPFAVDFSSPLVSRRDDRPRFPGEELVVVSSPALRHKIIRGYRDPVGQVVDKVNDIKIKNLRHLVEVLRDCKDDYVTFEFAERNSEIWVLPRKDIAQVTQDVMEENNITRQGTRELVAIWNKTDSEK
jgi:S1-C subfamily serine protease